MSDNRSGDEQGPHGWALLAWWIGAEAVGWLLLSLLGFEGSTWFTAVSLLIGILFVTTWGVFRVLRGHDL